jgi:transposase
MGFLRERVVAFPDLSAARLTREVRELGYAGAYTAVKALPGRDPTQNGPKPYEVRFETPPGVQAQVDFARFVVDFDDDPGTSRVVWLFSLVLGHSRFLFARYVLQQDLQTPLRCHIQAFEAIGGVPIEILYDRMKTAVTGEDDQGHIAYNHSLLALARHYRFQPRACRPYRAKTKGKVERPFSYIRQDFFVGRSFRNLEPCCRQAAEQPLRQWSGLETDSLQTPGAVAKGPREILGMARHLRLPADLAALVDDAHGRLFDGDIQTGMVPHAAFLLLMFVAAPKRRPRLPSARSAAPHLE